MVVDLIIGRSQNLFIIISYILWYVATFVSYNCHGHIFVKKYMKYK